jgi:hypothetical protein
MLNSLLLAIRFVILVFGHKQVALENVALRHQLAVFTREKKRPRLRDRDRLFWIALKKLWKDWRTALVFIHPETVIGWQLRRFKRYCGDCPSREGQDARECIWRFASWLEQWLPPIQSGELRASMGNC